MTAFSCEVTLLGWGKHDSGSDRKRYLVYELLSGGDCFQRLQKSRSLSLRRRHKSGTPRRVNCGSAAARQEAECEQPLLVVGGQLKTRVDITSTKYIKYTGCILSFL